MASCEERAAIGRWFCPRRQAADGWGKFPPAPRTKVGKRPVGRGPASLRYCARRHGRTKSLNRFRSTV